jgi:hypothetical protein
VFTVGLIVGKSSASSAQSKRGDTGIERGGTGLEGGDIVDGGRKTAAVVGSDVSAAVEGAGDGETARLRPKGADIDVGDTGGVYHTDVGETARFGGFWGKLGGWDRARGCSEGSSSLFRCFRAVVRGPEWARAEDWANVDKRVVNDAAVALGIPACSTEVCKAS